MLLNLMSRRRYYAIKHLSKCAVMGLLAMLLVSCDRGSGEASEVPAVAEEAQAELCLDPQQVKPDAVCTMDYTPVCGCDGKTYSNSCVAGNSGLSTWEPGECSSAAQED